MNIEEAKITMGKNIVKVKKWFCFYQPIKKIMILIINIWIIIFLITKSDNL